MADLPIEKTLLSLNELLAFGTDAQVEIIHGVLVEMSPVGGLHHIIVSNINRILDTYVQRVQSGWVFPDGLLYLMGSESKGLRNAFVPDVSFIRNESIPHDWDLKKPFPGAPDIAVEVMSPDDKAPLILQKVRTYLEKGTQEVWVVYPDSRELHQYQQQSDTVRVYQDSETLAAESLFPGIEGLTMDAIFRLPNWKTV
ncbi:MAG: Uma2 family endonuclease [Anaerolineae bacterium]|nr:Uma2 family endonuclease [Anaerolineae bacterium]